MNRENIYMDLCSSLAYEKTQEGEGRVSPPISVTTKAQIKQKCVQRRNERLFSYGAAASMLLCDGALFAMILYVGKLIGMQTGSLTAAGCYLAGMGFFTLTFLEAAGKLKHSAFLDGMAHIFRVIAFVSAVTLVLYSALRSPDSGGSILVVSLLGAGVRRHFKV